MKRNILLPTDFSDNAWSAAVYALKLYANKECTFYFLNSQTIKVSTLSNLSNKLLETMKKESLKELKALKELAETCNANANHEFKTILSTLDLTTAIKKSIKELNIDMIVMGTKGSTASKEFFFGSNTVHVINSNKLCPLLIVPDEFDFVKPHQIAFPTDFNKLYTDKELNSLKELVELYNSKIRVLHIEEKEHLDDKQERNLSVLDKFLSNYEHSFHWMPDYANKTTEINDFIEELNIDILAMVNYKKSIIEKFTKEPVIKKIGFQPTIPFLVISA
ncbi:universal stress protein [Seonamhaeicola sediminis]|uniref:Universal stress protein n=1 Tax=Seonamhaeicola sediminis TaxID=2528206 RepID=A0A562YE43_9FLAO|nr:universal stress protein [Seonamhaeicola sediminis]TWO32898.1 universal stress protein [Seonamhaeicola sediminis]